MSRTTLVLFATVVLLLALTGVGAAQTSPPPSAFDELSPGGQKIAKALFEAQTTSPGTTASKPLTLEEIAKRKQDGQGWGQVFRDMKSQGLVTQKNLGQTVSAYELAHHMHHGPVTTAGGRPVTPGNGRDDTPGTRGARGDDGNSGSSGNAGGSGPHGGGHSFGRGK